MEFRKNDTSLFPDTKQTVLTMFKETVKPKQLVVNKTQTGMIPTGLDFITALDKVPTTHINNEQRLKEVAIYNKFDISSIIAAALWKTMTGGEVFPSDTSVVPRGYQSIHWIGLKPVHSKKQLSFFGFKISRENDDKTTGFVYHDHGFKIIDEEAVYDGRAFLSHQEVRTTPLESMINHLRIPEDKALNSLCHALTKFMCKDMSEDELLTVFYHYEKAVNTLALRDDFAFGFPREESKEKFISFMRHVKSTLTNNYRGQYVLSGESGKYCYVLVTHISTELYPWAKRLVSMVHGNYLNSVDTANGRVIDTNLKNVKSLMIDSDYHRSHQFVI